MTDLESVLIVPKTILTMVGRWPQYSRTRYSLIKEIFFYILELIMSVVQLAELIKTLVYFDFDILFEIMIPFLISTGHVFKMILFKLHNKNWLDILNNLKSYHFNIYPEEFSFAIEGSIKFSRIFGNVFQFGCCCSSAALIVTPLFSDASLPIRCSFISEKYIPYMYIFEIIFVPLCALTHSSIDVITTNLIGISVGQLNILIEKIKAFKPNDKRIDLGECVRHHIEIIKFIDKLEDAVTINIMVEYVKSTLVICILGIQGEHVDPFTLQFAKVAVFSVVMILQLAIYCVFANEILVKSVEVGDACYHASWLKADKKTKTTLMLIMERSKRPLCLTSMKLSVVSLKSFTTIIKSAYTYFAMMQTLYIKNQKKINNSS